MREITYFTFLIRKKSHFYVMQRDQDSEQGQKSPRSLSRCKNSFNYFSQQSNQMEISSNRGKNVLFVVRLCSDVVLELLCWCDRRQLVSLEKLGKRFHLLIDRWFEGAPFLRLDLHIDQSEYIFPINKIRFLILFIYDQFWKIILVI